MSVRALLAFHDGFRRECRRREAIENAVAVTVAAFLAGGVVWLTWAWSPYSLKARVDVLEQRIEAIEKRRDFHWPFRNRDEQQAALKRAIAERAKEEGR